MKSGYSFIQESAVSEMAIVDTFTKLIFGEEKFFSEAELLIVQALRSTEPNVALDGHRDMGVYLRALGVKEMIKLVSQVQFQMASGRNRQPSRIGSGADFHQRQGI
jgi:hypothetical protein